MNKILSLINKGVIVIKPYRCNILNFCFLLIVIFSYLYLCNFIRNYQKRIEYLAIIDIQQSFVKYLREDSSWQLIEIILNRDTKLINQSEFIYELDNQLNKMFSKYIYYEVKANNLSLITNTYSDQDPLNYIYNFNLSKDVSCTLSISKNPNSQYFKDLLWESNKIITITTIIFVILFAYAVYLTRLVFKNTKIIMKKNKSLQQLFRYISLKKKNTKQYHNYYIESQHKLFSTPLLLDNNEKVDEDILDLKSLRHDLIEYVEGYSVYIENIIHLRVNIKNNEFVGLCCDKQIFHQIIFSITCNIIHFVKNFSNTTVEITFSNSSIQYSYNKSFPINKDILIINSDPVILNELSEPFILGFSNIFGMLEKLGMEYIVKHQNNFNIIEILFKNQKKQKSQKEVSNIIDISKVLNKKRRNDIDN